MKPRQYVEVGFLQAGGPSRRFLLNTTPPPGRRAARLTGVGGGPGVQDLYKHLDPTLGNLDYVYHSFVYTFIYLYRANLSGAPHG
jgi:hypothetical protein